MVKGMLRSRGAMQALLLLSISSCSTEWFWQRTQHSDTSVHDAHRRSGMLSLEHLEHLSLEELPVLARRDGEREMLSLPDAGTSHSVSSRAAGRRLSTIHGVSESRRAVLPASRRRELRDSFVQTEKGQRRQYQRPKVKVWGEGLEEAVMDEPATVFIEVQGWVKVMTPPPSIQMSEIDRQKIGQSSRDTSACVSPHVHDRVHTKLRAVGMCRSIFSGTTTVWRATELPTDVVPSGATNALHL
jgi:hypothetical protein